MRAVYIVISLGHCENTLLSPSLSLSRAYNSLFPDISFKHSGPAPHLIGLGLFFLAVTQRAVSVLPEQFQSAGLD